MADQRRRRADKEDQVHVAEGVLATDRRGELECFGIRYQSEPANGTDNGGEDQGLQDTINL